MALLAVVIIGAASLLVVLNASTLGLGDLDFGYTSQKGAEALALADGCMEETFRRIRLYPSYGVGSGTITLSLASGSCTIDVSGVNPARTVVVTGIVGEYQKKLEANLTLSGSTITLVSWKERE